MTVPVEDSNNSFESNIITIILEDKFGSIISRNISGNQLFPEMS